MKYLILILILSISYSNQISSISRDINDLSVMNSSHFIKDVTQRAQNNYYRLSLIQFPANILAESYHMDSYIITILFNPIYQILIMANFKIVMVIHL